MGGSTTAAGGSAAGRGQPPGGGLARRLLKRLGRSAAVQAGASLALSLYIDLAVATMRWRFLDREGADALVASDKGAIACFWHGRIGLAVGCRRVLKAKPRRVLISLSRDGDFIASTVRRLGFPAIRGSGGDAADTLRKGGVGAFVEARKFVEAGGVAVITPDGPHGPTEAMAPGAAALARLTGAPVILFGLAARPAIRLKSWDRTCLPTPFSRGCAVFVGPLFAPPDADAQALEALRADWQARLRDAQARAEAALDQG